MKIFGTKSPIDRLTGDKPDPTTLEPGRLKRLAKQMKPLLEAKALLDKVYSNGYFENHYPDADQLLKNTLHDRAMQAWAYAEDFGPGVDSEESDEKEESNGKLINLVINLG